VQKGRIKMNYHRATKGIGKGWDKLLFIGMILACLIGLVAIFSATRSFGSNSNIIVQSGTFVIGLIVCLLLSRFDYEQYGLFVKYIYIFCLAILVLVLLIGKSGDWGAQSWIRIGPVGIQPSEIAKLCFILTFSYHLKRAEAHINRLVTVLGLILHLLIPVGLIMLQPDAGSAMVFGAMFLVMVFAAGISYKYILTAGVLGVVSLPLVYRFVLSDYQRHRILVFFNPNLDELGSGYNVIQSKIAVGSGGIFGKGFLKGTQNQLGILPTKHTDFIFSTIAEEWGLIGAAIVVLVLFFIIFRCILIAKNANSRYGSYICLGVAAMLIFHTFENVGMCIGLMPVTGIPLPFISYGGTSLLTNMAAVGFVLNVSRQSAKKRYIPQGQRW